MHKYLTGSVELASSFKGTTSNFLLYYTSYVKVPSISCCYKYREEAPPSIPAYWIEVWAWEFHTNALCLQGARKACQFLHIKYPSSSCWLNPQKVTTFLPPNWQNWVLLTIHRHLLSAVNTPWEMDSCLEENQAWSPPSLACWDV